MSYRTYEELVKLPTFEERFKYLQINGQCSVETFGGHRLLNQMLYRSPQWEEIRRRVIIRDMGCDLGIEDRPIAPYIDDSDKRRRRDEDIIIIHHINPITIEQVTNFDPCVFDMNNLICCSGRTHKAIHYGEVEGLTPTKPIERKPGDTRLW